MNDFNEFSIKACQQRKRKLEQPDDTGDAKTYLNNLIQHSDRANFSLRYDEAEVLRNRALVARRAKESTHKSAIMPIFSRAWSAYSIIAHSSRAAAAISLAKFKVSQGEIRRAKVECSLCLHSALRSSGLSLHRTQRLVAEPSRRLETCRRRTDSALDALRDRYLIEEVVEEEAIPLLKQHNLIRSLLLSHLRRLTPDTVETS